MLRRIFIQGVIAGAAGIGPAISVFASDMVAAEQSEWPFLVGAWKIGNKHYVGVWSKKVLRQIEIPFRPHEILLDPLNPSNLIAIARRPGRMLAKIDLKNENVVFVKKIEADRRLNGHAVFSLDGKIIYTSENGPGSSPGFIGIRKADSFEKIDEYSSYGHGPHSIVLDDAISNTMLVANGGTLAIPDAYDFWPDTKFDSSLVRLSLIDGSLISQYRLDDPNLSIRHLCRSTSGVFGVALQSAHSDIKKRIHAPVLAVYNGQNIQVAETVDNINLNGYGGDVASVKIDDREYFYVGCMHADKLASWSVDGKWNGVIPLNSTCAVKSLDGIIYAPAENGQTLKLGRNGRIINTFDSGLTWDNHILALKTSFF